MCFYRHGKKNNGGDCQQRIDNRYIIPSYALIGKRPKEKRAVRRACIEQTVRRIAQKTCEIGGSKTERFSNQWKN